MTNRFTKYLKSQLDETRSAGLYKKERVISSPQSRVVTSNQKTVINFCANNYLGLSNHPELVEAAAAAVRDYGYGMSSVRFICGTQDIHKELENQLSEFLETEDTILYSSCFDANGGLFETLFGSEDAIISDSLNHASIIDGIRLCKAKRYRYDNNNLEDLENKLKLATDARFKIIATDGVFSMDGIIANLKGICDLADKYDALVMVDDSHAVGFLGANGKGSHEYCKVLGRIDIITGTLGKALGGASGGYTSGRKEIISWLRQRSRPYLFSNSLAPVIAKTSIKALEMIKRKPELRHNLQQRSDQFRNGMEKLGFKLIGKDHPIIPILLKDAALAAEMADKLMDQGIYVIGFSFPVVPKDLARIRIQISAEHTKADINTALAAFQKVGSEAGVIQ